jgi:hypothetical protein
MHGKDFVDINPNLMPELWVMDTQFNLSMAGAPSFTMRWPSKNKLHYTPRASMKPPSGRHVPATDK